MYKKGLASVEAIAAFDALIDVRSPAEFAEDHLPGAINCPVLDDAQRAQVGTLYKQVSAFEARRLGAAMVAENLARHLYRHFQDKPQSWRPLVYCWRGGMRSGTVVHWLRLVGWDACQLEGGYKRFRRHVIEAVARLAPAQTYRVVCGPTGSGKTRLLGALAREGAQVLDLEGLAAHRGSILGEMPDRPQPSQKHFETLLWQALAGFDPARPVFVEAESRKIGRLHLPEPLIAAMRASPCLMLEPGRAARLSLLLEDYAWLGEADARLETRLASFRALQSRETLARWQAHARAGRLAELFAELIDGHYDPLYRRSQGQNFAVSGAVPRFAPDRLDEASLTRLAQTLLQQEGLG